MSLEEYRPDAIGDLPDDELDDDDAPIIFPEERMSLTELHEAGHFAGLCEFEALLWDPPPLAAPGRIGRAHSRCWRCVRLRRCYVKWSWVWRRRLERLRRA